ncbi:MAG TPA: DUF5667 domain-containing protein [Frankiaceae bacterium]|nr:DUF5667 domain-containing protein [Frankiaceae bacterium]
MTGNDGYVDLERALGALTVPEDLAQRHLARLEAVRAMPGVVPLAPRRSRRNAVRATAAGVVVAGVLASGAGVAAASTAVPGDALYGLKTARERLQLAMSREGESRARLELHLARTRLGEAAELLREGDVHRAVTTLARADAALASAAAQGGDAVDAEVAQELDRRVVVLGGLLDGGLPETAADAAREAVDRALDRGARTPPPRPAPGPHATPPAGGKPSPVPSATPPARPNGHPAPRPTGHPAPGHPTGRPASVPSRGGR